MKKTHFSLILLLLVQPLSAAIQLAPIFQDGAVLQREKPLPVWGRTEPGGTVSVSFADQTESTTADAEGRWLLKLAPLQTNAVGQSMKITGSGSPDIEIKDILVGEVWLTSGQSNMQWDIARSRKEDQQIAASGPVPLLRLFQVANALSHEREETLTATWNPANRETSWKFSAVAYFFGRKLVEELGVPVGMMNSSWGGSRIEPWWAEEGLEGIPELDAVRTQRLAKSPGFPAYDKAFQDYIRALHPWSGDAIKDIDAGRPISKMPPAPELLKLGHTMEVGTYQAMIHPLVPAALRGFLWYQGESNNGEGMLYASKKRALIQGWRKQFQAPEAPFLFVQLAPFKYGDKNPQDLPRIWWAQQETLKTPHTGMAVTNDISIINNIHPTNKSEVGRRLALWALADTYGQKDLVKSGPLFSRFEITGNEDAVLLHFHHTGSGLASRDGDPLSHFEIAAADDVFQPATATISEDGKTILLTSPSVPKPDRARFAWSQIAEPNLMNKEGLPAGAFHTHWPATK